MKTNANVEKNFCKMKHLKEYPQIVKGTKVQLKRLEMKNEVVKKLLILGRKWFSRNYAT